MVDQNSDQYLSDYRPATTDPTGRLKLHVIAGKKKGVRVYVDLAGRTTRAKLLGADEKSLRLNAMGGEVPVTWAQLSDRRLVGVFGKFAGTGQDWLDVATLAAAVGETERAENALEKALLADGNLRTRVETIRKLLP